MTIKFARIAVAIIIIVTASVGVVATAAEDKSANNTAIIHEKLKADKKLVVATNMELTESEAKIF